MSADLHIHIRKAELITSALLFQDSDMMQQITNPLPMELRDRLFTAMSDDPNVHVGEVSWLKAALSEDTDTYVPSAVETINALIPPTRLTLLTKELIDAVVAALEGNGRAPGYAVSGAGPVEIFLREHVGEEVYTVSW